MIDSYKKRGWLSSINKSNVPNLKHIDEFKRTSHKGTKGFTVPYAWGTMGIAYRSDLVQDPINKWMDLLKPQKSMHGKIIMIKGARELMGTALKAKGYSINSTNNSELEEAAQLLMEQKPYVMRYGYIQLAEDSLLRTGKAVATTAYSGDALVLMDANPNIRYVVPEEGGSIWVDHWVVYDGATNKDLAYKFLNFMNEPKIAAQNAEFIYMATPNTAAKEYLSQEFLDDPTIHPKDELLNNLEYYRKIEGRKLSV